MHTENRLSHKPLGNSYSGTTPSAGPAPAPNIATRKSQPIPPNPPKSQFRQSPQSQSRERVQLPGSVDIWRSLIKPSRPFADQEKVFSVVLRAPPWIKRCSSRPFVDQKGVLRGPSWPFVDKKVFLPTLRGSRKGVLRGPSWPFVDKKVFLPTLRGSRKGVLRGPSWPFVDKKVFLPALRGSKRCSSWSFVALRG